jgi:hypothetical protein
LKRLIRSQNNAFRVVEAMLDGLVKEPISYSPKDAKAVGGQDGLDGFLGKLDRAFAETHGGFG